MSTKRPANSYDISKVPADPLVGRPELPGVGWGLSPKLGVGKWGFGASLRKPGPIG